MRTSNASITSTLFATAAIAALPLPSASAQEASSISTDAANLAFRKATAVLERGEAIEGHGRSFRATFDRSGFEFLPALGTNAPHDMPLEFRLEGVERGGRSALSPLRDVRPSRAGERIEFARGAGLTERYEVSAQGVYQSFVFEERPAGQGDLVVRGALHTVLFPEPTADGGLDLTWNGRSGVHYGGVVGIDADGDRVDGSLRLVDGVLELSLPAAFVDAADYPLVLDPLIGTTLAIDDSANADSNPALGSTDAGGLMAVWERRFSASHIELVGHRLSSSSGALSGSLIPICVGDDVIAENPSVAYVRGGTAWLAAYEYRTHPNLSPRIYVSSFQQDYDVEGPVALSPSAFPQRAPSVGGDGTGTDDEAFVAWREESVGVRGRTVTTEDNVLPIPAGNTFTIADDQIGNQAVHPKVSDMAKDRPDLLVVWELDLANSVKSLVYGRFYNRDGMALTDAFVLYKNFDQFYGHYAPAVSGEGERFVVAWERSESIGGSQVRDIVARMVDWDGSNMALSDQRFVANEPNWNESGVDLALTDSTALVSFQKSTGFFQAGFIRNVDPFTAEPIGEAVELPASLASSKITLARGSYSFDGRVVAAWGDPFSGDIKGQVYDAIGSTQLAAYACGDGGTVAIPGALAGNQDFTVYLRDSNPSSPAICVLGFNNLGFNCGGCSFVPTPDVVLVGGTDPEGNGEVSFPLNPGTAGAQFYAQWLTFPPNSGSCLGTVDFSTALQVRVDDQP